MLTQEGHRYLSSLAKTQHLCKSGRYFETKTYYAISTCPAQAKQREEKGPCMAAWRALDENEYEHPNIAVSETHFLGALLQH